MDGKKRAPGEEKSAIRSVLLADAGVPPSPARPASKAPLRDPAAAPPADDEPADIGVGGVEDDDDDEKVERFYALLANIRAMRGLLPPCAASTSSSCGGGGDAAGGARKRLRAAEPPWRPAFRMEDFEAAPAAPPSKRERTRGADDADGGESARHAVVVAPSPSPPHVAARCDSDVGGNNYKD